jgi:histidinol dehydrogenase
MNASSIEWDGQDARGLAKRLRGLQPRLEEVSEAVAEIISEVERGGDSALIAAESRFGAAAPDRLLLGGEEMEAARGQIPAELISAIDLAVANVSRVAEAEVMAELRVTLPQGQSVRLRSVPVGAAGVYAPGGTASYPSSALMCCVPAKVAGVERVAVATPVRPDGRVDPAVLAAAFAAGAGAVIAAGGAQAIAALALGTETIEPVDVIAGPGNRYVQEAKRQLAGRVGIDAIAGPSELMVVFDDSADLRWLALDLCAQGEHGADGLLVAASADSEALAKLGALVQEAAAERESVASPPLALVATPSAGSAIELANALAPEHLQLVCRSDLSAGIRTAGCVFFGGESATAFGDYAAGSNHVLPTGGSGRFTGPLGPTAFRRRIATVRVTQDAARELAPSVATLARAEGFPVHAESVEARTQDRSEGEDAK